MDLYLNQDPLSLSLQDMLDCDIKTEMESVLSGTDLSLNLGDLPPLDLDEDSLGAHMWFSTNSNSSNSNFNLDFVGGDGAAMMVNPNSVMPLTLVTVPSTPIKKQLESPLSTASSPPPSPSAPPSPPAPSYIRTVTNTSTAATLPPRSHLTQARTIPTMIRIAPASSTSHLGSTPTSIITSSTKLQKQLQQLSSGASVMNHHNGRFHIQQNQHTQNKKYAHNNNKYLDMDTEDKLYPKPAYSYSCLIAMALKNSKTGSLPVSDIYSFMCEHFPYFKTAPNGWKNSVRHNLSLNKCFEKIEKPAGNGSQRKGCLWAMNPAKIAKMDDEVQKWSRKDPMAIRKAMIYPENLEILERGEMKMSFRSDSTAHQDEESESSEEENDEDVDNDDIEDGTNNAHLSSEEDVDTEMEPDSQMPNHFGSSSIRSIPDSFGESSSLTDFDIEVADGLYEELDAEEAIKLNLSGLKKATQNGSLGLSSATLRRTQSDPDRQDGYDFDLDEDEYPEPAIEGKYIYKLNGAFTTTTATTTSSGSRRKQPLLLRATGPSII